MTFVNTVKSTFPGLGSAPFYSKREGVATNVGTVSITIPSSGSLAPTCSNGKVRIKTASVVAGGTVQLGAITATDGSTTVTISPQMNALAANALLDMVIDFRLDINATSITVPIIAGTQNSVHDVELAYNP